MPKDWYEIKREWPHSRIFVVGGGPSLKGFNFNRLQGKKVIATNSAFYDVPFAQYLYWQDERWLDWNLTALVDYKGTMVCGSQPNETQQAKLDALGIKVNYIRTLGEPGLSAEPWLLKTWCAGHGAINMAYLLGAFDIVLLGFDMRAVNNVDNYHDRHKPGDYEPDRYKNKFIPGIEAAAPLLASYGVHVYNATKDSALKCFQYVDAEAFL